MIKFCLVPGAVASQNDGDIHFVGMASLERLYNIRPNQARRHNPYQPNVCQDLIHLRPLYNGKYFDANERYPDARD